MTPEVETLLKKAGNVFDFKDLAQSESEEASDFFGHAFIPTLESMGSQLYGDKDFTNIPSRKLDPNEPAIKQWLAKNHLLRTKFRRNDYFFILDDKLVMIGAWRQILSSGLATDKTQKVMQVDFLQLKDIDDKTRFYELYAKTNQQSEIGGAGMQTNARVFLHKLRRLLSSVDSTCEVMLFSDDPQRIRIYQRLLSGFSNVSINYGKVRID